MSAEALPTLKCVVTSTADPGTGQAVASALESLSGEGEVQAVGGSAFVVHTALTAAELRDALRVHLDADDGLLVAEFEVWSGYGRSLDQKWLLARGH